VAGTPVDRARKPSAAGDTGASWRVPSAVMDHVCVARRVPPTRYAQSAGAKIAFQVSGEGPCDLVFVPGLVSHLDLQWQQPSYRRFVTALEHACRVIRFDKRGTGLSDPTDALPGMDERVADLAAVMDAAGSQAAVVFGVSDGGRGAIAFAAAHPARVLGLILYGTSYRGPRPGLLRRYRSIVGRWGEGRLLELVAPSLAGPGNRDFAGAFERAAASPRLARPGALGLLRPRECRDAMTGRNNDPSIDGNKRSMPEHRRCAAVSTHNR
jgi:pimeloyl-ACP methyl ester carboxylesterase